VFLLKSLCNLVSAGPTFTLGTGFVILIYMGVPTFSYPFLNNAEIIEFLSFSNNWWFESKLVREVDTIGFEL